MAKGAWVCVVEFDEAGVGYASAHPCPACCATLSNCGVTGCLFSAPDGFRCMRFAKADSKKTHV